MLGEKHSARSSHPNLATVKEIWEIAVRGRVGVGRGEVCVVPVLCLSLGLVLSRHFFLSGKGILGRRKKKWLFLLSLP